MIDALKCQSFPCFNGGACSLKKSDPVCSCASGYTGEHCEEPIDYCASNPCENDGTCVSLVGGYVCACTKASSGRNCEIVHTARLTLSCDGKQLVYSPPGMPQQVLNVGDYSTRVSNDQTLVYEPRSPAGGTAATFFINISTLPSYRCTLLHDEDDSVVPQLHFATDAGNGMASIWGAGSSVSTFILSKADVQGAPVLKRCATYAIYCV
jgi:hypothetical protein